MRAGARGRGTLTLSASMPFVAPVTICNAARLPATDGTAATAYIALHGFPVLRTNGGFSGLLDNASAGLNCNFAKN